MGYLTNRTINYLNIHGAFLALLEYAFGLFGPIYFYTLGFPLPEVFGLLVGLNTARIPLRFLSFPMVRLVGLKGALMVGTAGWALSFPVLAMVKGYDGWLLLYIIMFGVFNAMYWHCFHTFYSLAGETEHRGKQISVANSLIKAFSALAPLLSAIFITNNSFKAYFFLSIPLVIVMLLILSRCEDIPVERIKWKEGKKLMFSLGAKIHLAEAASILPLNFGWLFVMYFYVQKMVTFGGILTFGIVAQVIYQLWLGKVIDRGRGRLVTNAAGFLMIIETISKVFLPLSFLRILGLEALSGAANVHHSIAQPTVMYNTGKSSSDAFWYWLFAETAFDLGTILGLGSAAVCLYFGMPLRFTILLALPGICAVWWLTYRYFGDNHKGLETK